MRTMFQRGARASVFVLALASFSVTMTSGSAVHPSDPGLRSAPREGAVAPAPIVPGAPNRTAPTHSRSVAATPSSRPAPNASRSKAATAKPKKKKPKRKKLTRRQRVGFKMPVEGWVSSRFGRRPSGYHHGVDIACPWGRKIRTAKAGRVVYVNRRHPAYGRTIVIAHADGYSTLYGHSSRIGVRVGRRVKAGRTIAKCGNSGRSTGSHLHFELRRNGRFLNPVKYLTR